MWKIVKDYDHLSDAEYAIWKSGEVLLLILFCMILLLMVINIESFLIKQRRWKNKPLLSFYIYGVISVVLRIIILIAPYQDDRLVTISIVI